MFFSYFLHFSSQTFPNPDQDKKKKVIPRGILLFTFKAGIMIAAQPHVGGKDWW